MWGTSQMDTDQESSVSADLVAIDRPVSVIDQAQDGELPTLASRFESSEDETFTLKDLEGSRTTCTV